MKTSTWTTTPTRWPLHKTAQGLWELRAEGYHRIRVVHFPPPGRRIKIAGSYMTYYAVRENGVLWTLAADGSRERLTEGIRAAS